MNQGSNPETKGSASSADTPAQTVSLADRGKSAFSALALGIKPAAIRKTVRRSWPAWTIVGIVLLLGLALFLDQTRHGEQIELAATEIFGLRVGSPLELNGEQIGDIAEIRRSTDLQSKTIVINLIEDGDVADRVRRGGSAFHVDRFETNQMSFHGVTRVVRGPSIALTLDNPKAAFSDKFVLSTNLPPDPRIAWNSVRAVWQFRDVKGLLEGKPAVYKGVVRGIVEKIDPVDATDFVNVHVAYFETDEQKCPFVREGTRGYINMAELTVRGVEGDAKTVLYGSYLELVLDPTASDAAVVKTIRGESDAVPKYKPMVGEGLVVLESGSWLPANTPVFHRGQPAGYVHSVVDAPTSEMFRIFVRLYPNAMARVSRQTVFFIQPKFKAQLLKKNSLLDWEGPKIEIPDAELLARPAIEFINLSEKLSASTSRNRLYAEPKEEWLTWTAEEETKARTPAPEKKESWWNRLTPGALPPAPEPKKEK